MNYQPKEHFDTFMAALLRQSPAEWNWLVERLRNRLLWWLRLKSTFHASDLPLTPSQFANEVFEETLVKFLEILPNGTFSRYNDLEALAVTVAGYKFKENLASARRQRRLLKQIDWSAETTESVDTPHPQEEMLAVVNNGLLQLEPEEKSLLLRYFAGEELQEIAAQEKISPEACRKRKQRALEKLKTHVFTSIKHLSLILWSMMIPGWI